MLGVMDSAAANHDSVGDFMCDVDRTLLRENLKLSFEERAESICACCKWLKNCAGRAKSCDRKVMAVDLAQVIPPLVCAKVDFILIGGMAAILHGSARVTFDVDVVYSRTDDNIERLTTALAPHRPDLRNAPSGLPLHGMLKQFATD